MCYALNEVPGRRRIDQVIPPRKTCSASVAERGSGKKNYSKYLVTKFTPNITTCITSAPWTRKMPSRSPCPEAVEARGR